MVNIFLFLSFCFLLTFLLAPLIEKVKVPWIFAALLIGAALAVYNPFPAVAQLPAFTQLSDLGMYFLLFIIGLEIDLHEIKKLGGLIVKTTIVIISLETLVGTLFVHFIFGTPWSLAALVAMSFATVGEAILVPILDEFKVMHTRLGQAIIGVATLDDVVELAALIWLSVLLGLKGQVHNGVGHELIVFIALLVFTVILFAIKKFIPKLRIPSYQGLNLFFMLIVLFTYVGIGDLADMGALAAIVAGVMIKYFVTKENYQLLETHTKLLTYGFLAPIFFLRVGMEMNMSYLASNIWLVVLVILISNTAKMIGSWVSAKKQLGVKQSILMGLALSVRFSTSIIIITILYQNKLIGYQLFSVIVASSILFKFIIPPLFANLLAKWKVASSA